MFFLMLLVSACPIATDIYANIFSARISTKTMMLKILSCKGKENKIRDNST